MRPGSRLKEEEHRQEKSLQDIFRILMVAVLMAAFILLLITASMYMRNTTKAMETELCEKMLTAVEQTGNHIDYRLEQVAESGTVLLSSIYSHLSPNTDVEEQLQEYEEIQHMLQELWGRHMITSLRLYVPDSKVYINQQTPNWALYSLEDLQEYQEQYKKGGVFWQTTHPVGLASTAPTEVITCAAAVKSPEDYEALGGVLCADIEVSQFDGILTTGIDEKEEMFLVDERGVILAHHDETRLHETIFDEETIREMVLQGEGYFLEQDKIVTFCRLGVTDWFVVSAIERPLAYMMDPSVTMTLVILCIAVLSIIVIVVIGMLYSVSLKRTVSRINQAIHVLEEESAPSSASTDHRELAIPDHKGMGIFSLERDAEQLVRAIAGIVETRYREQLAVSEYQMESLQAQIKPHFLYNTLDAIKWRIMEQETKEGVWMVNALSKYFRMSINKGQAVVVLSEELELTSVYLKIMQKRFEDKFQVVYEVDEEAQECRIPKLSLQPLVENALLHGILPSKKDNLRLIIRSWISEDMFGIEIEDNGCGMDQEQVQSLSEANPQKGYGVSNVRKRLDIFAHGKCKFMVTSRKDLGTCVAIELPLARE